MKVTAKGSPHPNFKAFCCFGAHTVAGLGKGQSQQRNPWTLTKPHIEATEMIDMPLVSWFFARQLVNGLGGDYR
jgi:hypothetical protein